MFSFLDVFENGKVPNHVELRSSFVEGLGIEDERNCRAEIHFLKEQIVHLHTILPSAAPPPTILTSNDNFILSTSAIFW